MDNHILFNPYVLAGVGLFLFFALYYLAKTIGKEMEPEMSIPKIMFYMASAEIFKIFLGVVFILVTLALPVSFLNWLTAKIPILINSPNLLSGTYLIFYVGFILWFSFGGPMLKIIKRRKKQHEANKKLDEAINSNGGS